MQDYDAYLFDLDGTIYLGEELLPGVSTTLAALRDAGKPIRFVTNNPTRLAPYYAKKLNRLGICASEADVITSVTATVRWLTAHHPAAVVYPIGEAPLVQALQEAGLTISEDPAEIDIVLASFDRTFTYAKLQIAFDALWFHKRAILVSTNPDRFCPYPGGRGEPDAAAIVAAIEASTGLRLSETFGKPGPHLADLALASISPDIPTSRCLMVGDRLETDIAMAHNAGMDSALVLTGDSRREDIPSSAAAPTWIVETLPGVLPR